MGKQLKGKKEKYQNLSGDLCYLQLLPFYFFSLVHLTLLFMAFVFICINSPFFLCVCVYTFDPFTSSTYTEFAFSVFSHSNIDNAISRMLFRSNASKIALLLSHTSQRVVFIYFDKYSILYFPAPMHTHTHTHDIYTNRIEVEFTRCVFSSVFPVISLL